MALAFLAISTLLQGLALGFAVRIALARGLYSWFLLVLALALMFVRRAFSFHAAAFAARPGDPVAELLALMISALLVVGLAGLARSHARTHDESAPSAGRHRNALLQQRALVLAGAAVVATSLLAGLAYAAVQTVVTERLSRDSQEIARVLVAAASLARQRNGAPIPEVEQLWSQVQGDQRHSYLCIIGSDGRLALHTSRPKQVGTYVGDTALSLSPNQNSGHAQTVRICWTRGANGPAATATTPGRSRLPPTCTARTSAASSPCTFVPTRSTPRSAARSCRGSWDSAACCSS